MESNSIASDVLAHLLDRLKQTPAQDEPFSHFYIENVLPPKIYEKLLDQLPDAGSYHHASEKHQDGEVGYVRTFFNLDQTNLERMSDEQRRLWAGVASALMDNQLKEAVYQKLHKDLEFRYGISTNEVPDLAGYARPVLFRETEGFEIPPHPDTRKKVVTMHLYLPRDRSQLGLGTALYQRRTFAWPFGTWHHKFIKVKQFSFQPNSGYAFVVNNTLTKKSWHGREKLPAGAGVRNTLLMTYYETPKEGFHLPVSRAAA